MRLFESAAFCTSCGLRQPPVIATVQKSSGVPRALKIAGITVVSLIGGVILLATLFPAENQPETEASGEPAATAEPTNTPEPTATPTPLPVVRASDIAEAYDGNKLAADNLYKGKTFRITGVVMSVGKDILGNPYISFDTGFSFTGMTCYFSKSWIDELANVQVGKAITVQGKVDGHSIINVAAKSCALLN